MAQIEVRSPNVAAYRRNVDEGKYLAMRTAVLRVMPARAPGLTQAELFALVAAHVDAALFPDDKKRQWWAKTVQMDLECRGALVREVVKPLRWHLASIR